MKPKAKTTEQNVNRLWLIDASIVFFRYYFSLGDFYSSEQGMPTTATYGFCQWLVKFLVNETPQAVAICFDESLQTCFRNDIYPAYKSSRVLPDDTIAFQLKACQNFAQSCGLDVFASDRYEADDLIATLAKKAALKKIPVTVITRDKDLAQVITQDADIFWDYPEGVPLTKKALEEKNQIRTSQVATLLALTGDKIDDIPGVPGIGQKTAKQILQYFDDWFDLRKRINELALLPIRGAKKLTEKIQCYESQINTAFQLASLMDKVPLDSKGLRKRKKWMAAEPPDFKRIEMLMTELGIARNMNALLKEWQTSGAHHTKI